MCDVTTVETKQLVSEILYFFRMNKQARITVTGSSMFPFLHEQRDSVELAYLNFSSIQKSDIVLIKRKSGQYVLHRVIRKEKDFFYIAGDAHQSTEGPLTPDQVIAYVKSVYRNNKQISCNNFWWKLYSYIWILIIPYRHRVLNIYRVIRQLFI